MFLTQLIISLRLKHKVDIYVRYVNIVNLVLFAKTLAVIMKPPQKVNAMGKVSPNCPQNIKVNYT